MLGFFTDPYPDELLYSACARYSDRARYLNRKTTSKRFFGGLKFSAILDFPTRLNTFIASLPEGHLYTIEKLINENTLLPFYESFLPIKRAKLVRQEMSGANGNKIHVRLGLRVNQLNSAKYLRFCPICADEDRNLYGETYWHRMHQLTGILICPKHKCFLEDSHLKWDKEIGYYFKGAEQFVTTIPPRYLDDKNLEHNILLKLSQDAQWLLSQNKLQTGTKIIRDRYFNQLLKLGFAYYNGRLQKEKLLNALQKSFSPKLFEMIGCVSKSNIWILALAHEGAIDVIYHPIRHLLLITFLGLSAEEFFNSYAEFKAFGDPPYPCLNPASNHYGKLKIKECKILNNISKDSSKQAIPVGFFRCNCGFTYERIGPDKTEKDKFTYSRVKDYGKVWEDKLTELWADLSLTSTQIGNQLGITQVSVSRHAIRLNLPVNTEETRSLSGYERHRNPRDSFSETLQNYRRDWLEIRRKHPNLTRKELSDIGNYLFFWLKRYDREWVMKHVPEIAKKVVSKEALNWSEIDKNLEVKIKQICDEIFNYSGFPIRCSITEIIKRVGNKTWIEKREQKLPITTKIINEYIESLEDFMIRKIQWAEKEFLKSGQIPRRHQLRVKAVVRNNTSSSAKVQRAIDESLKRLEKKLRK